MKADLQQQWQQARQQWQSNPRLRLLAGVVVLILIISVLQGLHQTQVEARQQARQQWQRLQDVRQLSQESHWHDYAEHAQQAHAALQQQLWQADSDGQAQAKLRDIIQQALKQNGLAAQRVNVTSLPAEREGWLQVRADINGEYLPGAWQDFLYQLSQHQPRLIIEQESVNRSNRRPQFRLGLHAWFVISGEES